MPFIKNNYYITVYSGSLSNIAKQYEFPIIISVQSSF